MAQEKLYNVTKKTGVPLGKEPEDDQLYGTYKDMDNLVDSKLVEDRIQMACIGYGVDKLKDDADERVRLAVAKGGYYTQQFINDSSQQVKSVALEFIKG